MVGIVAGFGFVGMVLAPCAVALYSRLGSSSENRENGILSDAETASTAEIAAPLPPTELTAPTTAYVRRPVPLSTSAAPMRVPSLREVAETAAQAAKQAQALAAQAQVTALQEASRAAAKRAEAAEKLAEAAERELVRATQASLQAETLKARAKLGQKEVGGDYLPHDHPSLDFPRSRVASRRVA